VPYGPWVSGRDRWVVLEAGIPSPDPELEATVAVQAVVIVKLRAANAEQAGLITSLQARVAELERRLGKDSSNSSKPPSADGLAKATRRARGDGGGRRPGKQPGTPGAHLAQVADPDEIVVHVPERCGGCGGELARTSPTGSCPALFPPVPDDLGSKA
jgi:transposase